MTTAQRTSYLPKTQLATAGLMLLVSSFIGLVPLGAQSGSNEPPKPQFNESGQLIRPEGYRKWTYIGTPLTPNDLNPPAAPFPDFHNVYIHPGDYDHFQQTGQFRDGTVIVKELVSVGSKQAVSGKGYFMGEYIGLEATIKDSKRFAKEPGYWAYFSYGHEYPLADVADAFPAAACNACHESSAATDFVFTQYYPVLRAARATTGRTMSKDSEAFKETASAMARKTKSAWEATAETPSVESAVPTETAALFRFLKDGGYKSFSAQESAAHASRGPHAKFGWPVRVFLDTKMDASLKAGNVSHPAGAAIVKEMYNEKGDRLMGWAVMVKTGSDSDGGKGWFWHETTNTRDATDVVASGNGVPGCFGCHSVGEDFVLTGFPLQ
jgi:hypothetical protein